MPRYDERSGPTRLYVGHISSGTRTRDLEDLFRKYGRIREVDMKHDFAFVNFSDARDADEARHYLNGRTFDGNRIVVEFARGGPRGGISRDSYGSRGPPPGTGRCYNCGHDGHWARDCTAGDWKNKCYRCGERGHIERDCRNSPRRRLKSRSRSPVARRRRSPSRSRSQSRSRSRSHERTRGRSPRRDRSSPLGKEKKSQPSASRSWSRSPKDDGDRGRSISPDGDLRNDGSSSRSASESPRRDTGHKTSSNGSDLFDKDGKTFSIEHEGDDHNISPIRDDQT